MSKQTLQHPGEPSSSSTTPTSHPPRPQSPGSAAPSSRLRNWWRSLPGDGTRLAIQGGTVLSLIAIATLIVFMISPHGAGGQQGASSQSHSGTATVAAPPHSVYDAQPPAAPAGDTVDVKLTTKEALISIAPGVAYHAWTFNGTVPGPILRVRQGQTVNFTLVNSGDMPHSIDFHAAQTPWSVNYQSVAPGKSLSFTWKANYPGVFLYHCGTPPALFHIANGMYGAIIVDPAEGWAPAQEYVLVQSEFYTRQNADGTYSVDGTRLTAGNPNYVVFNGYANQYKDAPLTAKAGQKIRLFVVNAGPSDFSAFHVIGAIFSDTYIDGNPANHMQGDQTVTIPPGGGDVMELTIPDAGSYPVVTHSFKDASMGALGFIKVAP